MSAAAGQIRARIEVLEASIQELKRRPGENRTAIAHTTSYQDGLREALNIVAAYEPDDSRSWIVAYAYRGGGPSGATAYRTEAEAAEAAKRQAQQVTPDGRRCITTITYRDEKTFFMPEAHP